MGSKTISFRDLQVAEELSHLNEIQMLHIDNDPLVNNVLRQCGMDIDYGVAYIPSKHVDMQGRIAIGYMAVGEVSINREYIDSPLSSSTDRLVAAGYRDVSLAQELLTLATSNRAYSEFVDTEYLPEAEDVVGYDEADVEEDYEWVSAQIQQLEDIRDALRGSMFNSAGTLKTAEEYQQEKM